MKAVIPVAGYGTRLLPHTRIYNKALLPVAGKAALDFILEPMLNSGFADITFIVGHLGDQIREHMKTHSGSFRFIEQKERLGLGHAVLQGLGDSHEPVLVQLGDTIFPLDYQQFTDRDTNCIVVGEVDDPRRFGTINTDGKTISGFYEKDPHPPTNLAIAGLYYFADESLLKHGLETLIAREIKTGGEYQLTDAMALMLGAGQHFEYRKVDRWYDVGVPDSYIRVNRALLTSNHGEYPGTTIREPVHVGNNCRIEDSTIGPYVTIMDNCTINNCKLIDCIVLTDSQLTNKEYQEKIIGKDGSDIC
ncbi:MAG: sugar phosphate nucleotidyltransferase [Fidelibacterota bacterium]